MEKSTPSDHSMKTREVRYQLQSTLLVFWMKTCEIFAAVLTQTSQDSCEVSTTKIVPHQGRSLTFQNQAIPFCLGGSKEQWLE